MTMFLVEDDTLLRDSMVLYFRTQGCGIHAFASAEEARPVFPAHPPDIVICDHWLPGMDGLTFLKQIGAQHPGAIKLLISAYPSSQLAEEARSAGIDEYLLKPFSIEELEQTLERLLKRRFGEDSAGGGNVMGPEENLTS